MISKVRKTKKAKIIKNKPLGTKINKIKIAATSSITIKHESFLPNFSSAFALVKKPTTRTTTATQP